MSLAKQAAAIVSRFYNEKKAGSFTEEESVSEWYRTKEEVIELFLQEDWELTDRIIRTEVQEAFGFRLPPESKQEELEDYFEGVVSELQRESTFKAYVYLPQVVGIPSGKTIGNLEIIDEPEEQSAIEHVQRLIENGDLSEGRTWGRIEFKTFKRRAYIREELFENLQIPLSILKISLSLVSTPENVVASIFSESGFQWHLEPREGPNGWARYREKHAEPFLTDLSDIASKDESQRTPLEDRILQSLRLLNLHSINYRYEHSFLTLIAVLEGLLLNKYERPKGSRVAEKCVYLLHDDDVDIETKVKDYERMKRWYRIRSNLIHGGFEQVTQEKVESLEQTVQYIVRELVELSDEFYSIQKQGGENNPYRGLNNLFLEKRLGGGGE